MDLYSLNSKSDRQIRRQLVSMYVANYFINEHRLSIFYSKQLSKKVEKEWWLCITIKHKQQIETSYYNQERMLEEDDCSNMWASFKFFSTWKEWFEYIRDEYKPDMVKYREVKLKKLGI
jgi:hypothetical protein